MKIIKNILLTLIFYYSIQILIIASPTPPDYFPLKLGNKWNYIITFKDGEPINYSEEIINTKEINGIQIYGIYDSFWDWIHYWAKINNEVRVYACGGGKDPQDITTFISPTDYLLLLKLPLKGGDKIGPIEYTLSTKIKLTVTIEIVSKETVSVPAGIFNDVYKVESLLDISGLKVSDVTWYAPNVGKIKSQRLDKDGNVTQTVELESYEVKK